MNTGSAPRGIGKVHCWMSWISLTAGKNCVRKIGCYVSRDFVYMDGDTIEGIVFCDGSVHDQSAVQEDDRHKRQLLRDAGYDVIEWHYSEPPDSLAKRRKDIFRKSWMG